MIRIKRYFNELIIDIKFIIFKMLNIFINKQKYKNLWVISERGRDARDNGYALFKYIRQNHPEINVKFIITKKSSDYLKVKQIGDVIEHGSREHYFALLNAKVLISTHLLGYTPDMYAFRHLLKFKIYKQNNKIVFLQHGISKDKINIYGRLDLIVSGAKKEYDFFKDFLISYKENIKYTGFPRYDTLNNIDSKIILLMPTWRVWLRNCNDFKKTNYYNTYQSLLNNKELIELLNKENYRLIFYPHIGIQPYIDNFYSKSDRIIIATFEEYDVQELLNSSSILITDYSSVFFDFAYLKKPIVYYQFDKSEYRKKQFEEGYFIYERDGFGPVVSDENKVVDFLSHCIDNNLKLDEKFLNKINKFFVYNDKNNCKRVFNEIIKIL